MGSQVRCVHLLLIEDRLRCTASDPSLAAYCSLHIPSSQITSADVNKNAFIPECREPVDELRVMRSLRPKTRKNVDRCPQLWVPAAKENLR
jgi:hypothetical protein